MASTDSELITEVRALSDYTTDVLSDSEFQELVDLGKEELKAEYNDPQNFPGFFNGSLTVDRALFWFVFIAAKVRTGEISGISISAGSFLDAEQTASGHDWAFTKFKKRVQAYARQQGPAKTSWSRDSRTYGG